jgi:TolB-like protein/tetratricopeptide (TPR) repeat protein
MSIIQELKRRNVIRVGIAYGVAAWLLLQIIDVTTPIIGAPDWVPKALLLLIVVGFPITILLAWAFELTPEGVKFARDVDRSLSITRSTGRTLDFIIIAVLSVAVVIFALDKFLWSAPAETVAGNKKRSIAVLPFENMSGDPNQLFFSDGISEEILNSLVRVDGISVASRTSSFGFRGESQSIREIAEELQVLFVLEGSVRKAGERVRITAQLIDAEHDRHLWSETYDRDLADIFAIQSEIANAIARSVRSEMGLSGSVEVPVKTLTENMSAYDLYLKGRSAYSQRYVSQHVVDSIDYLEQAVVLDPQFAVAWAWLAAAYSSAPFWYVTDRSLEEYIRLSEETADKALAIDPGLALPIAVKGSNLVALPPYEIAEANRQMEIAISKGPAEPTYYYWLGEQYQIAGFAERGLELLEKCLELDPLYTNCLDYTRAAYHMLGQVDKAKIFADKKVAMPGSENVPADVAMFVLEGNRAAALLSAKSIKGFAEAPVVDWVNALENPAEDHGQALRKFDNFAQAHGVDLNRYPSLLAILGAYDRLDFSAESDVWYWFPPFKAYRSSAEFKQMMREYGRFRYWKSEGFPPQCRPLGEDDFECD